MKDICDCSFVSRDDWDDCTMFHILNFVVSKPLFEDEGL